MARAKQLQIEVLNPKKVKPDWELLYEQDNPKINRLIELYKENPKHARIIYKQGNNHEFQRNRVIAYTYANGDINIVQFRHSFGISVTNKMYQSEKNMASLIHKKETNKWYSKTKTSIKLLNYNLMNSFIGNCNNYYATTHEAIIKEYMFKLLPWLRNLGEDKYTVSHDVAFNTIISKELFNVKSIYRHVFGIPYPVIEMMMEVLHYGNGQAPIHFVKSWKEMKKVLINVENLKIEMFRHHGFMDACKMAGTLNQKINCSWGIKRFTDEHDAWAKEISNVLLLNQKNTKMNIFHIYEDFAEYSGYELLRTNFDMVHDGLMMNHCVATYIDKVDRGECAIYKVDGYTMELNFGYGYTNNQQILRNNQIKGYKNELAPKELVDEVQMLLDAFNYYELPKIKIQHHPILKKEYRTEALWEMDELPF
jgi:hypothetical protein